MLLFLFGAVAVIVATYFTYKTANEYGRSGVLSVGFGLQLIAPFVFALILAIVFMISGTARNELAEKVDGLATAGYYLFWALSFIGLFLIIKYVSRIPDDDGDPASGVEPPPPPRFGNA